MSGEASLAGHPCRSPTLPTSFVGRAAAHQSASCTFVLAGTVWRRFLQGRALARAPSRSPQLPLSRFRGISVPLKRAPLLAPLGFLGVSRLWPGRVCPTPFPEGKGSLRVQTHP